MAAKLTMKITRTSYWCRLNESQTSY